MSDLDNLLNETPTKKGKTAKAEPAPAKKGKTAKAEPAPAKKGKTAKAEPAPAKKGKTAKADGEAKPKRMIDPNVSMTQPDDSVVLKAVRKLKEATLAASFAHDLGVHRRVIRAQLQRLAKDKANGVKMIKDGAHWLVSNTAK